MTPGQAAALALWVHTYNKNPKAIQDLFAKHEQKFTGDPNVDLLQTAMLSHDRGKFFDEDLEAAVQDPNITGAKLGGNLGNFVQSVKDAVNTVKPIVGQGLQVLAPIAGQVANSFAPGSGAAASGLASGLGAALTTPSPKATNPNDLSPAVQQQLAATFGPTQTDANLDVRPSAAEILAALKGNGSDTPAKTIMGMSQTTFYIGLSVVIILVVVAIILVMRHLKKKNAAKKAAA